MKTQVLFIFAFIALCKAATLSLPPGPLSTLQTAVDSATEDLNITLESGVFSDCSSTGVIFPESFHFTLQGAENTIIDCGRSGRAFTISSANVAISSVHFLNGEVSSSDGGFLLLEGACQVAITSCIFAFGNAYRGGAVAVSSTTTGTLQVKSTSFLSNSAALGGALVVDRADSNVFLFSFSDCVFENNSASTYGGFAYTRETLVSFSSSLFSRNEATSGAAVYSELSANQYIDCNFTSNVASDTGGALSSREEANIIVSNCHFMNNSATSGGAIHLNLCEGQLENSSFVNNTASENGGAVYSVSSSPTPVSTLAFESNSALYGGSVFISGCEEWLLSEVSIVNSTSLRGGAIYINGVCNVTLHSSFIANCSSLTGGSLFLSGASVIFNMSHSEISSSQADLYGGAAYIDKATFLAEESTFSLNHAQTNGGSLFLVSSASLLLQSSTINGSTTDGSGGGVYIFSPEASVTLTDTEISSCKAAVSGGGVGCAVAGTAVATTAETVVCSNSAPSWRETGQHCVLTDTSEICVDPCYPNPCLNGGMCSSTPMGDGFSCECGEGWAGPVCGWECASIPQCAANATLCPTEHEKTCSSCLPGYYPSGSTCEQCLAIPSCDMVSCTSPVDSVCVVCESGMYVLGTDPTACLYCPSPAGCDPANIACTGPETVMCGSCLQGYYPAPGAKCAACLGIGNCNAVLCSSALDSTCEECAPGFYRSPDGSSCLPCPSIPNCRSATCSTPTDTICTQCADGFYGDSCAPCANVNGCLGTVTCSDRNDAVCSRCPPATVPLTCQQCDAIPSCLGAVTCLSPSSPVCSLCPDGSYPPLCTNCTILPSCVGRTTCTGPDDSLCSECSPATFGPQCEPCLPIPHCAVPVNCSDASASVCEVCDPGYFSPSCQPCPDIPLCAATIVCTSPTDSYCPACASGFAGPQCQLSNPCMNSTSPCWNGGVCSANMTPAVWPTSPTAAKFTCSCDECFAGEFCERAICPNPIITDSSLVDRMTGEGDGIDDDTVVALVVLLALLFFAALAVVFCYQRRKWKTPEKGDEDGDDGDDDDDEGEGEGALEQPKNHLKQGKKRKKGDRVGNAAHPSTELTEVETFGLSEGEEEEGNIRPHTPLAAPATPCHSSAIQLAVDTPQRPTHTYPHTPHTQSAPRGGGEGNEEGEFPANSTSSSSSSCRQDSGIDEVGEGKREKVDGEREEVGEEGEITPVVPLLPQSASSEHPHAMVSLPPLHSPTHRKTLPPPIALPSLSH